MTPVPEFSDEEIEDVLLEVDAELSEAWAVLEDTFQPGAKLEPARLALASMQPGQREQLRQRNPAAFDVMKKTLGIKERAA
jgi:hypothetical protein